MNWGLICGLKDKAIPQHLPPNTRIIEGVMATVADADRYRQDTSLINIAPMGPIVDAAFKRLILRPFTTSTTYRNLKQTGQGVFHVTDDALLIARGAIGQLYATFDDPPAKQLQSPCQIPVRNAKRIQGVTLTLTHACRAYEFRVTSLDDSQERTHIEADVIHAESLRDFLGFNRAKHAVVEAAILATRTNLTGTASVLYEYERLQIIVDKTGDADEHTAMRELCDFVKSRE